MELLREMRTWLVDFLFQCLNALNQLGEANTGVIKIVGCLTMLRMLALREKEANKEQQKETQTAATIQVSEEQFTTLVSRIVAALEANAPRTSQPKESLTAVEDLPPIKRTHSSSLLPQFLSLRAIPGQLPMEQFLPPPALPKGCLPPPALPKGFPPERCLPIPTIEGSV